MYSSTCTVRGTEYEGEVLSLPLSLALVITRPLTSSLLTFYRHASTHRPPATGSASSARRNYTHTRPQIIVQCPFIVPTSIIMHHTSSLEEPGLRPWRGDTLDSGPPSFSHRTIPMRAAQISSAIHSVFEARQLITTGRARLRPILPALPTSSRHSRQQPSPPPPPPLLLLEQQQVVCEPSSSNSSNISSPFVMLETEEGSESVSNHSSNNNNNDMRIQAGTVSPLGERNSSRNRNPTDADWNQYRTIITRLYWDENLSMPVVRDYMKREHGFDATYVQSFLSPSCFCHDCPHLHTQARVWSYKSSARK